MSCLRPSSQWTPKIRTATPLLYCAASPLDRMPGSLGSTIVGTRFLHRFERPTVWRLLTDSFLNDAEGVLIDVTRGAFRLWSHRAEFYQGAQVLKSAVLFSSNSCRAFIHSL